MFIVWVYQSELFFFQMTNTHTHTHTHTYITKMYSSCLCNNTKGKAFSLTFAAVFLSLPL